MRKHEERGGADPAEQGEDARERSWWRFPPIRNALVSGLLLAVTFILARSGLISGWAETTLYVVAAGFGASHWGREAVESVIGLRVNIDVLMGAATVGAAALGLWEEAAFLAFLYGGAEGLEELTYDRTRGAIRALLDLAPKEAHLLREGVVRDVPAEALEPGDRFLVRPGESLPTDGVIRTGDEPERGARHGGVRARRERGGRSGLRRHRESDRRHRGRRHAGLQRQHALAHHPPGRGGAGREDRCTALHRSLRRSLQPGDPAGLALPHGRAATAGRGLPRVGHQGGHARGGRSSLRARDVHTCGRGGRGRLRRPAWGPDQGRAPPGEPGPDQRRGLRQDGHAHTG